MTAPSPGIAAQNAPYAQPYAFDDSVCFYCLYEVGGAAGLEPASAVGAAKNMQRFADESFVEQHRQDDQALQHPMVGLVDKMFSLEQTRKVLLKLVVSGCGCSVAWYDDHVMPLLQGSSMCSQDFAHASAQQIAHHGMPQSLGCDNPETGTLCTLTLTRVGKGAEYKKTPCCG